ncbi:MAG TPA: hypothetical protein VJ553_05395 [Candidatus Paceibacterota bacterium]|nr:hypothetical protein [Candidatus Paceibacterota bacterium]
MSVEQRQIGIEGLQQLQPGQITFASLGSYGNQLVSDLYGKFGEMCRRGYVFAAVGAAAAAIPIGTTLTNAPVIWNVASSGKLVIPLRIILSLGAIGTPILNGFAVYFLKNTGDSVGTGLPIVTFTEIAPVNTFIGRGVTARTKFAGAVATYTTQPAKLMDLGFGHHLEGAAASGQLYSMFYHDFDGAVMMPPGTSLTLGSTIATSTTYWTTILFAELPIPQVY